MLEWGDHSRRRQEAIPHSSHLVDTICISSFKQILNIQKGYPEQNPKHLLLLLQGSRLVPLLPCGNGAGGQAQRAADTAAREAKAAREQALLAARESEAQVSEARKCARYTRTHQTAQALPK